MPAGTDDRSRREALPALRTATAENLPAEPGFHTRAEPVRTFALEFTRLECALHGVAGQSKGAR